jgi:hypothetical protein
LVGCRSFGTQKSIVKVRKFGISRNRVRWEQEQKSFLLTLFRKFKGVWRSNGMCYSYQWLFHGEGGSG